MSDVPPEPRGPQPARNDEPGTLSTRLVHDGRIVHLSLDRVRFPDGSTGELEMVRHAGASAVLAVVGDPDDEDPEIVLIRQYRYATGGEIYEVPAGMPDREGEPWEDVARRELEEETGWRPGGLREMTWIYTTPGFTDERIHLFLAWDLEEGGRALDVDEFVEVVTVPLSQALEWIREGRIVDAKSMATILYGATFALGG